MYSILGGFLSGGKVDPFVFSIFVSVPSNTCSYKNQSISCFLVGVISVLVSNLCLVIVVLESDCDLVAFCVIWDTGSGNPTFFFIRKPSFCSFCIYFYSLCCWQLQVGFYRHSLGKRNMYQEVVKLERKFKKKREKSDLFFILFISSNQKNLCQLQPRITSARNFKMKLFLIWCLNLAYDVHLLIPWFFLGLHFGVMIINTDLRLGMCERERGERALL